MRSSRASSEGGDARDKLRRLFRLAASSDERLTIDLAVGDWSRRDSAVAERLRLVDHRRLDYMRKLFAVFCRDEEDVEARCMLAFSRCGSGTTSSPPITARARERT